MYHAERRKWEATRNERGLPHDAFALVALKMRKIGRDCSSTVMTGDELTEMIKGFKAVTEADNLDAQLTPKTQKELLRDRCFAALEKRAKIGHEHSLARVSDQERYLGGMAWKQFGRAFAALDERQLGKLAGEMEAHAERVCERVAKADAEHVAKIAAASGLSAQSDEQEFCDGPF